MHSFNRTTYLHESQLACIVLKVRCSHSCTVQATATNGTNTRKTPPRPTVMPPPMLPVKEDEVWTNAALLVDKPLNWTSSDVVCKLRNALDVKKIGHAGTLDPLASGLLVVCIGKGTKSSMELSAADKSSSGVLRLGEATPSYDAETAVSETSPWEHITDQRLQDAATEHFTGELQQV